MEEELEDSFLKYAGEIKASRRERTAYHLSGTPEPDGFLNLVTLMLDAGQVRDRAREYGVSVTEFLCAAMMEAILELQAEKVPLRRRRPVKVLLPVNLRRLFPSRTLRNFALYVTPEVDPKLGHYTFQELCSVVHHRMGMDCNAKTMGARITTNVSSERVFFLKIMPLFIKNLAMKAVFDAVGERKSCLCLSNLGQVKLPEQMAPYVERMDFVIGVQARAPHNCGVLTYGDTMYVNLIRNIQEPELEMHFTAPSSGRACPSGQRATSGEQPGKGGFAVYCIKCGVELADSEERCPLCGTVVFHPELTVPAGEKPYPPQAAGPETAAVGCAVCADPAASALPLVTVLLCGLELNGTVVWSGYVARGAGGALRGGGTAPVVPAWDAGGVCGRRILWRRACTFCISMRRWEGGGSCPLPFPSQAG